MRPFILAVFLALFFSSCDPARRAVRRGEARYNEAPEITISANDDKYIYRASEPITWDITHTRVALSFNWQERTADGEAWIDLRPYFYPTDSLILDAKGMQIHSVAQIANGVSKNLTYTYKDNELIIPFNKKYTRDEDIRVYVKYKAMPYATVAGGSAAITEDRGLYFINTKGEIPNKPRQIWTQGETESNSNWLPTIDKPNQRMTVQVELTVPDTMQSLSNGLKISSEPAGKGQRIDIWKMDKPIQVYATMFAIGKFAVVTDKWRDQEVSYYVEDEYAPYARKMFNHTPEMMEFFSGITGVPYPWQKYSQVVVRDYVSGAMENTTASLYGEFMNQNAREIADNNYEDIVSHELFHQWFGDYVTQESWSNLTLSESFANYGEQLWRKHKYGKESADKLAYEDLEKYIASKSYNSELVRYYYSDKEDMFDRVSYEKGGAILNYLHGLVGDEAFYKAMNIYLTRNALSSAEVAQWRMAVEEATGKDWNWFFNQFYMAAGHPHLDIRYNYDDVKQALTVTVTHQPTDSGSGYRLPLKTGVIYKNEKTVVDWNIAKKKETFSYPYRNGIKPVIVPDVYHWLPGTIKDNKAAAQWLVQFTESDDYISKRLAIDEAVTNINDNDAKLLIDNAIADRSALVRAYALSSISDLKGELYVNRWKLTIENLAAEDPDTDVRAQALYILGAWQAYSAKKIMLASLTDSSYEVAGSALSALAKIDDDTTYVLAKNILTQNPRAGLAIAAERALAAKGNNADISYFEQTAPYVYGSRKLAFTSSVVSYLTGVTDMTVFEKGLNIISKMAMTEEIKSYRRFITYSLVYSADSYKKKKLDHPAKMNMVKSYSEKIAQSEPDPKEKAAYISAISKMFPETKK